MTLLSHIGVVLGLVLLGFVLRAAAAAVYGLDNALLDALGFGNRMSTGRALLVVLLVLASISSFIAAAVVLVRGW